ncbi:hypothetical protein V5O48_003692 [Marasmius crinis-equi]|uniref:Uncharacterized protein n=1 Tax=Marasmius crinis-equi TaxID=585013 RepID=A0ABR3FS41_9AGAR
MSTPAALLPARRAATKQCEVCQATFTRKTHLNRHMRSHTNDRSHVCKLCNSQFTRSDLLTRHKKICGGFRSRRKSCQACAKAKSRCDLKTPSCSKCMTRGIACEYVTGPAARKNLGGPPQSTMSGPPSTFPPSSTGKSPFEFGINNGRRLSPASDASSTLFGSDSDSTSLCSTPADIWPMASTADIVSAMNSSLADNGSSYFNFTNGNLNYDYTGGANDSNPSEWTNFYSDIFTNSAPSKAGWPLEDVGYSPPDVPLDSSYPFPDSLDNAWHLDMMQQTDLPPYFPPQYSPPRSSLEANLYPNPPPSVSPQHVPLEIREPVQADYAQPPVEHFNPVSDFLNQLPMIHSPTWTANDKPEGLIKAMQACGALYLRTPESEKFVSDVLKEGREEIIMDFARQTDAVNQMYSILALVLIQTVGLFHASAEQRHSSAMYHTLLTTMISRNATFLKMLQWTPPLDLTSSLESVWRDWVRFETAKRIRCLLYLHDCCQSIYFATPQNSNLAVDLHLPCESALWNAQSAQEWYECLQMPSRYGSSAIRLKGVSFQQAWAGLVERRPPSVTAYTSTFGHLILIHQALAKIYLHMHSAWDNCDQGISAKLGPDSTVSQTVYAMQNVLQNWLLNWQYEMQQSYGTDTPATETPFSEDGLPFYWLAQVSLLTLCEGKEQQEVRSMIPDARYRVVKGWLARIRECLRSNRTAHAQFTNELMELRSQYTPVDMINVPPNYTEGLLQFFHSSSS